MKRLKELEDENRRLNKMCGKPFALRCDNGPEYISQKLLDWANDKRITLLYIQPGKPTQNAYVERFNRTVRHEWLDLPSFDSIEHAQLLATQWLWTYNNARIRQSVVFHQENCPGLRNSLLVISVSNGGLQVD